MACILMTNDTKDCLRSLKMVLESRESFTTIIFGENLYYDPGSCPVLHKI